MPLPDLTHRYTYDDKRAGVREYWIVDPSEETVQAFVFDGGSQIATGYDDTDVAPVTVLPGCEIDLKDVFAE
jgi:Uma2 family endonuclease